jgi:hypothetical protein
MKLRTKEMTSPRNNVEASFEGPAYSPAGIHYGDVHHHHSNSSFPDKKNQESEEEKQAVSALESEKVSQVWEVFCQNLKKEYREGRYIQRLFYPENPLPVEANYIHLTLVKDKYGFEAESRLQQIHKKKYENHFIWIKSEIKDICLMPDDSKLIEQGKLYVRRSETNLNYMIMREEGEDAQQGLISKQVLQDACLPEEHESIRAIFENEAFNIKLVHPFLPILLDIITAQQHYIRYQETEVVRTYAELFNPREPCALSDVVGHKRVLITGIAGVGKTTLGQYLCYVWAQKENSEINQEQQETFKKFKFWGNQTSIVISVALRNLMHDLIKITAETTAIDFLWDYLKFRYGEEFFSREASLLSQEQIENILKDKLKQEEKAGRLVLILDGYDEVAKEVYSSNLLEGLLKKLLMMQRLILTSRPYYLDDLSNKYRCYFEKTYRITGFSNQNVHQYIDNFFSNLIEPKQELGMALKNYLQSSRSLWGTCHVPINLELICSAWDKEQFREESLTITELYNKVIFFLCKRYLQKCNKDISTMLSEDILEECAEEIDFLKHLAFIGILKQKVVTSLRDSLNYMTEKIPLASNNPREWRSHFIRKMLKAGFLKSIGVGESEADKHYYFLHRTFQEYFAACYLVDCLLGKSTLPSKNKDDVLELPRFYIMENRYDENLEVMWWFVAGQLYLSQQDNSTLRCLEDFFNVLLGRGDEIGHHRFMLAVRCWDETRADNSLLNRNIENSLSLGLEMLLNKLKLPYLQPLIDRLLLCGFVCRSAFFSGFLLDHICQYMNTEEDCQIKALIQVVNKIKIIPDTPLLSKILQIIKNPTKKHQWIVARYLVKLLLQLDDKAYKAIQTQFIRIINSYSLSEYQIFSEKIGKIKFKLNKAERVFYWLQHPDVRLQQLALIVMKKLDHFFFYAYFQEKLMSSFINQQSFSPLYLEVLSVLNHQGRRMVLNSARQEEILQYLIAMGGNKQDRVNTPKQYIQFYLLLESNYFLQHIDLLIKQLFDLNMPCATSEIGSAILSLLARKSYVDLLTPNHLAELKKLLTQQPYELAVQDIGMILLNQLPLFVQRLLIVELLLSKNDDDFLECLRKCFLKVELRPRLAEYMEVCLDVVEGWKQKKPVPGDILAINKNEAWELYLLLINSEDNFIIEKQIIDISSHDNLIKELSIRLGLRWPRHRSNNNYRRRFLDEEDEDEDEEEKECSPDAGYLDSLAELFTYGIQWENLLRFIISSHFGVSKTALYFINRTIHRSSLKDQQACYSALIKHLTHMSLEVQEKTLRIIIKEKNDDWIKPQLSQLISILMSYWTKGDVEKKMLALPWLLYLPLTKKDKETCINHIITILTDSEGVQYYEPILQFFSAYYLLLSIANEEPSRDFKEHAISSLAIEENEQVQEISPFEPFRSFRIQDRTPYHSDRIDYQRDCFQSYHDQVMKGANEEGKKAWSHALCAMPTFIMAISKKNTLGREKNVKFETNELTNFIYDSFHQPLRVQLWKSESKLHVQVFEERYVLLPSTLLEKCRQSNKWIKDYIEKKHQIENHHYYNMQVSYLPLPSLSIFDFVQNIPDILRRLQSKDSNHPIMTNRLLSFQKIRKITDRQWIPWICQSEYDNASGIEISMDDIRIERMGKITSISRSYSEIHREYAPWKIYDSDDNLSLKSSTGSFISIYDMIKEINLGNTLVEKFLQSDIYSKAYRATIEFLSNQDLSDELCDLDLSQIEQLDVNFILQKTPLQPILESYFKIKNEKLLPIIVKKLVEENKTIEIRVDQVYLHGKILEYIPHTLIEEEKSLFSEGLRRSFSEMYGVNLELLGAAYSLELSPIEHASALEEKQVKEVQDYKEKKESLRHSAMQEIEHSKGLITIGVMVFAIGIVQLRGQTTKEQDNNYLQSLSSYLLLLLGAGMCVYYRCCNRPIRRYGLFQPALEDKKREEVVQQRLLRKK